MFLGCGLLMMENSNNNVVNITSSYVNTNVHSFFQYKNVDLNGEIVDIFEKEINNIFEILSSKIKTKFRLFEIHLESVALITDVQKINRFQISSITIFFYSKNWEWDFATYSNLKNLDSNTFIQEILDEFLTDHDIVNNKASTEKPKYILLNKQTIISVFTLLSQYLLEMGVEAVKYATDDVIEFINYRNQKINFFDLVHNNLDVLPFVDISNLLCKKKLQKTDSYISVRKLVNYSTLLNFSNGCLNLILILDVPSPKKIYLQVSLQDFLSNLYSLPTNNEVLAYKFH